jgi:hypothetical protein
MIIDNLRKLEAPGVSRIVATVHWEDSPRPPQEIFFEVDASRSDGLTPDPNAILTGCYLPAIRAGERRVRLAGPVCPVLRDGLAVAASLLQSWYGGSRRAIPIESDLGFRAPSPRAPPRAAFFLTGGIDSLAMLRANRQDFPASHPGSFRDAIAVFGLIVPGQEQSGVVRDLRNRTIAILDGLVGPLGIRLVPIVTNLSALAPDLVFFELEFASAALLSAAHLFPERWSSVSIASGRDVANLFPQGTHPLLDASFATAAVSVRHEGMKIFRLDKLRTIASWDEAIENLTVCMIPAERPLLNCGVCEKCVRTMTELVALGRLSTARQFPYREVTPAMIDAIPGNAGLKRAWAEMLPELRQRGRDDLVRSIERKLGETRRIVRWFEERGLRGRLRRLDRSLLGGRLIGASRAIRRAAARKLPFA